jgi:hypothetical protein
VSEIASDIREAPERENQDESEILYLLSFLIRWRISLARSDREVSLPDIALSFFSNSS